MPDQPMRHGAPVTFTASRLGLVADPMDSYFVPQVVTAGDSGVYAGLHPNADMAKQGWHICTVEVNGRHLYAPVHSSHFAAGLQAIMADHGKWYTDQAPYARCRESECGWRYRGNSQVTSSLATVNRNAAKHADETGHEVFVLRSLWKLVEPSNNA